MAFPADAIVSGAVPLNPLRREDVGGSRLSSALNAVIARAKPGEEIEVSMAVAGTLINRGLVDTQHKLTTKGIALKRRLTATVKL